MTKHSSTVNLLDLSGISQYTFAEDFPQSSSFYTILNNDKTNPLKVDFLGVSLLREGTFPNGKKPIDLVHEYNSGTDHYLVNALKVKPGVLTPIITKENPLWLAPLDKIFIRMNSSVANGTYTVVYTFSEFQA
jgi:hypothetical protein